MPDLSPELLALGFIWYVAFLFSTTCHEAAHALVAKIGGDETASSGGQVTLNPMPHIQREPWGMVVIPLLSFLLTQSMIGWASAPFDPSWERRHPRRSAWMALAGPAANYSLMLLAVLGLHLGWSHNWLHYDPVTHHGDFAANILNAFFFLNLCLARSIFFPFRRWTAARASCYSWARSGRAGTLTGCAGTATRCWGCSWPWSRFATFIAPSRILPCGCFSRTNTRPQPFPQFFVSVASKGVRDFVSCLFATLAGRCVSVASKGVMAAWRRHEVGPPPQGFCKNVTVKELMGGGLLRMCSVRS